MPRDLRPLLESRWCDPYAYGCVSSRGCVYCVLSRLMAATETAEHCHQGWVLRQSWVDTQLRLRGLYETGGDVSTEEGRGNQPWEERLEMEKAPRAGGVL